jgi:FKBP-type peptidyl-prolyl cis-trans isomerase SlpA
MAYYFLHYNTAIKNTLIKLIIFYSSNRWLFIMTQSQFINPNEDTRIAHGSLVKLHFEVSLENGTIIDSTFNRDAPVSLTIGDESLLPGFEKVLMNLRAGDTRTAHLEPEQAFGEWNPENIQHFSRTQFALVADNPEIGMMVEFEDKGKNTLPGTISAIDEDQVEVDFNHPLAGQDVLFKVKIFKVTPPGVTGIKLM